MNFKIRAATKEDCKEISRMIMELSVFVKMPDQVKISHEELERDGFCQNPFFECLIAEVPEESKSKEGTGIDKGLLSKVAEIAKKKQCVRLQLSVLNWNALVRDFCAAKGAQDLTVTEGWHFIRFDGQNLDNLANEAPKD
ncbi:thialysine N-epsilon-acetyltransferase-like isoform X3 [Cheilinus undulatus]|uniref:thialysine N-epsilon-acetyltransferase-like isoform X3 n=1 Tax=Cheilinus undulatus TaxID=241271 RepID=UPI001BD318C6|nr:thialysine N-epsilon-acetyltransferase-like isoform X3 [Cheilinus undulatus]